MKVDKKVKDRQIQVMKCIDQEIFKNHEISKICNCVYQQICNDKTFLQNNGLIEKGERPNEWYLTDKGDLILEHGFDLLYSVPGEEKKLKVLREAHEQGILMQSEFHHCNWLREHGFMTRKNQKAKNVLTSKGYAALEAESILKTMIKESE